MARAMRERGSTHLLLFTRYRADATLQQRSVHPWEVMTAAEKIKTLRDIFKREVERMVAELVEGP